MKQRARKLAAMLLAGSMILGTEAGNAVTAYGAEDASVGAGDLSDQGTLPPDAWGVVPSPNQYRYQKDELAAFCHFGPNTFEGVEWGEHYGDRAPSDIFRLEQDFDADTIVKAIQDAGFKKLIITAKHHDGFCLWKSEYTDYDVEEAGYKNGEGDVLAEISAACTKYDVDMGLYLSPWDIHEPSYGYYDKDGNATTKENDVLDYNEHYNNQLKEILGNDKYGNDGHFVEVWMDGAKGSGANAQEYDFPLWFETIQNNEGIAAGYDDDCLLFGAEAYTTVRWIGNELGIANEETWSKSRVDYTANTIDSNRTGANGTTIGIPDGNKWTVPEADSRITSGWFWTDNSKDAGNPDRKTPKTLAELSNMYFNSVGHNAVLLLNVPPNTSGTVDKEILDRLKEFGDNINESFKRNLAENATVTASSVRGNDTAFSPENVIDGDDSTYWTMEDGSTTGSLTLDLGESRRFDMVTIEEAIQLGQRIKSFQVEYQLDGGEWQEFASGTTIGAKRICRAEAVTADKVRIRITDSYAVPVISEAGVYKASNGFEIPSPIPDGMEKILVSDTDISDGSGFSYTGTWNNETGSQFIGRESKWANAGASATLKFTGHKVWLFGTKDPSHGTADIYIDEVKVGSIDTQASQRATAEMIYESEDLDAGEHTLRLVATGTIGLNAAAVLNNGEKGLVQFEAPSCKMPEDSVTEVVVKRVGGSKGQISVDYENNPGSAVQGHYDIGIGGTLTFEDGETEKTIRVATKRYDSETGDLIFTVDLKNARNAILGFHTSMQVTILDLDQTNGLEEARQLLSDCKALNLNLYEREAREEIKKLTSNLETCLSAGDNVAKEIVMKTALWLKIKKENIKQRSMYTREDPFVLPVGTQVKTAEAELFQLDGSNAANPANYVRITSRAQASNGKEVNWFESGNRIILPFTAEKAGTYRVTATYRSGRGESSPNALEWSGTNIASGSQDIWGESGATNYHTEEILIEITAAGEGELIFTASAKGGPVLDKFEFECEDQTVEPTPVTSVTLDAGTLKLTDGEPYAFLNAAIHPEHASNQNVTFESSDPDVVSIEQTGRTALVTGLKNGSADITVTTEDGAKTASCSVSVERRELEADALENALSAARPIAEAGQRYYTKATWDVFKEKYDAAVNEKDTADSERLKTLTEELAQAFERLDKDSTLFAQTQSLEQAVSEAKGIMDKGQGNYSAASWKAFCDAYQKACEASKTVIGYDLADVLSKLNTAKNGLTTGTAAQALRAPTGVKAVSKPTGDVVVTFQKVEHASSYDIYRQSVKIASVTGTSYTDAKAPAGKSSTYTVIAVSSDPNYKNSAKSAGAGVTMLKKVTKLKVKAQKGGAKITFKKVKGAKKYLIYRASNKNGPYKKVKALKAKQTSFVDKKLKKGKYYYKVVVQKGKLYSPAVISKRVSVKK